ncbi:hypothetical protein HY480_02725 [Candidatus Uhrbacteria bacterium]|nr:hypothetical protein [Candidatus Uhrbacteria bacterium]
MQNERVAKFMAACFGSGCMTLLGLLILAPQLGTLAAVGISVAVGAVIGYVGFEFRETCDAILEAACETIPWVVIAVHAVFVRLPYAVISELRTFTSKPRPFFWLPFGGATIAFDALIFLERWGAPLPQYPSYAEGFVVHWLVGTSLLVGVCFGFLIHICAMLGVTARRRTDLDFARRIHPVDFNPAAVMGMSASYSLALRFYATAAWNAVYGTYALVRLVLVTFPWAVIHRIHQDARLICMVDGPLGGVLVYAALRAQYGSALLEVSPARQLTWILLGGIAAAVLGLVNALVIAPAIMRLAHERANR